MNHQQHLQKYLPLLTTILFFNNITLAQRVEIELNSKADNYQLVSLSEEGVVIFSDQSYKIFGANAKWIFSHYNKKLEEVWETEIEAPKGNYIYQDFDTEEGALFMIFTKFSGEYLVIEVNTKTQTVTNHHIDALRNLTFQDFVILNRYIFISGTSRGTPVILHYQLGSNTPPQILKSSYSKKTELEKLDKDILNRIVKVTSTDWKGGNSSMRVQSYLENGEQVFNLPIAPKEEKNLLTGKLSVNKEGKLLLIGTFANRNSRYADGIYIGEHDGNGINFMKFYNFTELQNYFDYLPKGRKEALMKRSEKKQEHGKDLNLQYRLLVHDIFEKDGQYILTAESYYPIYRYERRRDGSSGGRLIRTVRIFDGFKYTHAIVAGFNDQGNLTFDGSFAIESPKLMKLKELVRVGYHDGLARILYSSEGKIFSKSIKDNEIIEGQAVKAIPTEYESDDIKKSYVNNLEYWYDNYFLAWGFQKIRNNENSDVKLKRSVLYFNKVEY